MEKATTTVNREARSADTREKSARRKPWTPPSRLDAPPAPPGYKHRWIRAFTANQEDRMNIATKVREGYELVRSEEYPDFPVPSVEDGRHAGIISVGDVLLARIPLETVEERQAYYNRRAIDQVLAIDNELMKSNAHNSMRIESPSRQSRTTFGSPGPSGE